MTRIESNWFGCRFFLDNTPYVHVKFTNSVPLTKMFIRNSLQKNQSQNQKDSQKPGIKKNTWYILSNFLPVSVVICRPGYSTKYTHSTQLQLHVLEMDEVPSLRTPTVCQLLFQCFWLSCLEYKNIIIWNFTSAGYVLSLYSHECIKSNVNVLLRCTYATIKQKQTSLET